MEFTNTVYANLFNAITKEEVTFQKLLNASSNVFSKAHNPNDPEVDYLLAKIEEIKWTKFKSKAKRHYGNKLDDIHEHLTKALNSTMAQFNLTDSKVQNRVKSGGDMISGNAMVDVYISYKNTNNQAVSLGAYQTTGDQPKTWRVCTYKTGSNPQERQIREFAFKDFEAAEAAYIAELSTLASNK